MISEHAAIKLALALHARHPEKVTDGTVAYCATWPEASNREGVSRAALLVDQDQEFEHLLGLFGARQARAAMEEAKVFDAEWCARFEALLADLSARRRAVVAGLSGPSIFC